MWKPTNLVEAMLPIFILSSIFCHGAIQHPRVSKSRVYHSFLYSIISTIFFLACFIFICVNYLEDYFLNGMFSLYFINTTIMSLVMFINIIVGWVYKNKSLMIYSRIIMADQTLKELGLKVDVQKEFISIIKIAAFWVTYGLFVNLLRTFGSSHLTNFTTQLIITFTIQHGYHVNFLIDLTFSLLINHMKIRFKSINNLLLEILRLQDNNLAHQIKTEYRWAVSRRVNFEKDYKIILRNIKRIHLQLGIMCRDLTKIYGVPIVLTMMTSFANITSMLMVAYISSANNEETLTEKLILFFTLIPWTAIFGLKFFLINYNCAETVNEWKKTGEIIHLLELQAKDIELQKEIQQFSIQIMQNPLKFSPCGLLDLGYYFMREFAASVTGQVILSIQTYRFPAQR